MIDPAKLSIAQFAPLAGDTVTLRSADGEIVATLAEVTEVTEPDRTAGLPAELRTPFSLRFRGPREPRLQQGIHAVEHPSLGAIAIFLVPVSADETGADYEAVFG